MAPALHRREYSYLIAQLRAARTLAQVTQEDLAERLGVHQTVVSKCERGIRRLDLLELRDWVRALGLSFPAFVEELDAHIERNKLPALK